MGVVGFWLCLTPALFSCFPHAKRVKGGFVFLTPALSVIAASHAKHVPAELARLYRLRGGK